MTNITNSLLFVVVLSFIAEDMKIDKKKEILTVTDGQFKFLIIFYLEFGTICFKSCFLEF